MHITHVNFANGFRGGERQTLNLAEGLAQLAVPQLLVCKPGSELEQRARAAGIAVKAIGHPLTGHLGNIATSLIHVHEARAAYWTLIEHVLRGTPYLITRRIPNPVSGSAANRLVYRRAARLIGVSHDVARRLQGQAGREVGVVLDSCTALAVDAERTRAIRTELGGGPVIGHVGALHDHHKGQSILIAAFQKLTRHYPDARLVLLGEGPDRPAFQKQALGDPRIVFAGFQQDVGSWLAAFDVFAFPSREEGLGSSVLDAMSLGVPVVSAAVGGLPELVGADERGLMVNSVDPEPWSAALRRMLEDASLRARLRDAAQVFAAAHDTAAMTRQYVALYEEIISRRAASA
ncbi:MAG: glycosyltransferase [Burkholderiaceae bacterium]|nr:glycosyltransferase [Burkholderiaceae bacterium]